jgi:uncharacterized protein YidB (DUF937 family)
VTSETPGAQPLDEGAREIPERLDLQWLTIGKRAGLDFSEMNELRCQDLADYVDALTPSEEKERVATQADIDSFLS